VLSVLTGACGTPPPLDAPLVTTAAPAAGEAPRETDTVCTTAPVGSKPGLIARVVARDAPSELGACALLKVKAGAALDEDAVDRDVKELFATGLLEDVVVTVESGAPGDTLVFQVSRRPKIGKVALEGGKTTDPAIVGEVSHLRSGTRLSRQAVLEAEEHIENAYFEAGYRKVKVKAEMRPAGEGLVDVIFRAEEGPVMQVASVAVEGNTVLSEAELRALLDPVKGQPVNDARLDEVQIAVMEKYREAGRIVAQVADARLTESADGRRADVVFQAKEGALFKIGKLTFAGVPCLKPAERTRALGELRAGVTARPSLLRAAIDRMRAACAAKGQPVAIAPSASLDEKKQKLDIAFTFEKAVAP